MTPGWLWLLVACCPIPTQQVRPVAIPLNQGPQAVCRIVTCAPPSDRLGALAVRALTEPVKRWSGADLPVQRPIGEPGTRSAVPPPGGPAVVLATLEQLAGLDPDAAGQEAAARVEMLDDHAFVLLPAAGPGEPRLIITGRTPRAVFHGAVYAAETLIDGPADALSLAAEPILRAPQLRLRPVYVLTIWGEEDQYRADDWLKVFEAFARDGATHVYFWLSGHYPSKTFPQTFRLADRDWDSTADSRIDTLEDQRRLIQGAHDLGMRFYLGGGLGAWCGTFMLTDRAPGTMRRDSTDESGQDVSEWALCPADERAREALVAYYREMFDSLPEADGLYLESADEYGACACPRCAAPSDAAGGRMFGQHQLSLVRRIMHEIWQRHPHARLCYTIGYGPHRRDASYYEVVRQIGADPRIEWMEARDSWDFPAPGGGQRPARWFSPRVLRWEYFDLRPLENLVANTGRAALAGLAGTISTFSPGFASGSFHHDIPFPTDRLPYVLTQYVWRESAWEPAGDLEALKRRVETRFFGRTAPPGAAERLWELRELLRGTADRRLRPGQAETLSRIEAFLAGPHASAWPKAREGLELMRRAVADIRALCVQSP